MKRFAVYRWLLAASLLLSWTGCSTVKHLPEDEVLYLGTRSLRYHKPAAEGEKPGKHRVETGDEVIATLWVKPNGALFGLPFIRFIPFRLYMYNWFYTEEDSTFSRWMMENFGEPPVTIGAVNPENRVRYIENELFNRGYFGVEGDYSIQYKRNGENKAWIRYEFTIPDPYLYREVGWNLDSAQRILEKPVREYMKGSLIRPGNPFNLDEIAREKQGLWEHLQNEGYYYLRKDHILIIADTTAGERQVDLQYRITAKPGGWAYRKVTLGEPVVRIDSIPVSSPGSPVKEQLLRRAMAFESGSAYALKDSRNTLRNLNSLGIFSDPQVTFAAEAQDSARIVPDVKLQTTHLFDIGLDTDLTVKDIGYIGPGLEAYVVQKNLFRGAQNLRVGLGGYIDLPYGVFSDRISRSSGLSAKATLSMPVLSSPLPFGKRIGAIPRRDLSLGFEVNNRADYFRMRQWTASYGIHWRSGEKTTHRLNLVNFAFQNLTDTTAAFNEKLGNSAILRASYRDKLFIGPSYAFTYNNTLDRTRRIRTFYSGGIESSGNLVSGLLWLSGRRGEEGKKFLGLEYSQYIRVKSDFRAYLRLGSENTQLAFRNLMGWGAGYGNSSTLPYSRQFFVGGSNSLRPVTARTIGPGRYLEFDEDAFNQVGDIRIENNLELRFKIWYIIHGAVWADLGNIWLLNEDPDRPLSGIRFGKVFEDSYLTAGVGVRLDLDFLVVRADYGALLYFPVLVPGSRWIWENRLWELRGLVFGIGYPF